MSKPHVLMTGLVIGESPRWHDGRLWVANWGAQEIIAVEGTGRSELIARVPTTIPFSIDWLPDGRLLVVSGPEARLLRLEPDGAFLEHVDTSRLVCANTGHSAAASHPGRSGRKTDLAAGFMVRSAET